MKTTLLALIIFLGTLQAMASSSRQCEFSGNIEKLESDSINSVNIKVHFSSRTFKTWIFGGSTCKKAVGKTFTTSIPTSDEYLEDLNSDTSKAMTVFMICPEEAPSCFWGWRSYKLTEQ